MPTITDFLVRRGGAENATSTVRGERCSCTHSAEQAAKCLADKLFGPALISVERVREERPLVDLWRAVADDDALASCDDAGLIYVMPVVPPGNVTLAHGPHRALLLTLSSVLAPLGQHPNEKALRVPGFTASFSRESKDLAIASWLRKQSARNGKRGSLSVLFATTVVRSQP